MKRKKRKKINFLKIIPQKNVDYIIEDNGEITLVVEKSKYTLMKAIIKFFNKSQNFHIHLDKVGSIVWKNIDGKKTIEDILAKMEEKLGEDPTYVRRLRTFMKQLEKSNFINYINLNEPEVMK